ncbi:porin [Shewanella schlegeliana]|uniref:Porin n=1 Tax=Shewanella schlegeliana TaxID=190308 RepID=A0ABS1SYY2_9GAMM|nr:porin [Shewanella schlegeliana]MBL4913220.1 porin [Shewanella schlegeliana]MCL1109175.1 porin [Shewanella schlegeliana]GIU24223.1 porin [Shewanella schlegeliana]
MKKTLVASALAAVIFVPTASAIEIYKDDKNAVEIGGFVDARIINTQGATEVVNGASRINFGFTRQMSDGWKAYTKLEWGVNPFGDSKIVYNSNSTFESQSGDFLNNRLGYVGLGHDTYGSITIGKQWGAWYDVVYNTNYGFVWDGNASGTYTYNKADGAINGTGRGDKTVQYRNAFGDFSFALQAQLKQDKFEVDEVPSASNPIFPTADFMSVKSAGVNVKNSVTTVEYNYTYGGAATYNVTDMLTLTAGFNLGEFEATTSAGKRLTETDSIYGVGATWGNWDAEGVYAAFNVNKQEFHDTDNLGRMMPEAKGLESLASYKFENGIRTFVSYNILDAGSEYEAAYNGDVFKRQFVVAGVHYVWDANTVLYLEGRKDYSDFNSTDKAQEAAMAVSEDDGIAIGIRYTL